MTDQKQIAKIVADFSEIPFPDHEARLLALAYVRLREAAQALYEEVEMAESVGICLPDRVPSLRLGQLLLAVSPPADEAKP